MLSLYTVLCLNINKKYINKKIKKVVDKPWSLEYTNKGVSDDTK